MSNIGWFYTRNDKSTTNILAVCTRNMQFVYMLPGWEGSAVDSHVLRDAVCRLNGLKVPEGRSQLHGWLHPWSIIKFAPFELIVGCCAGCYYLCDNGYANSKGFLTPYNGVWYHLKEWGPGNAMPQNPKEMFNMRHTKTRNDIERAFAVLKMH